MRLLLLWYLRVCDASADFLLSSKVVGSQPNLYAAKDFAARWLRRSLVFVLVPPLTVLLSLWLKYPRYRDLSKKSLSTKSLSMTMSLLTRATATILLV